MFTDRPKFGRGLPMDDSADGSGRSGVPLQGKSDAALDNNTLPFRNYEN
jgi:hypothetical protein